MTLSPACPAHRLSRAGLLALLLLALAACSQPNEVARTLDELTAIRERKQAELTDYFEHVAQTVSSVSSDALLIDAFTELRSIYLGRPAPDGGVYRSAAAIEQAVINRYLDAYQVFYDIHFIEAGGDVFYTILKQPNLFRNVFEGDLGSTALARRLAANPRASTVDFSSGEISTEPSAFFAEPVQEGGEHRGWIVFQFASSRLNEIFPYEPMLGSTGEVFLVNRDQFMLTDSYNSPESAVLRTHLSARNIQSKFAEREGLKTVIDYRGYEALTSFEVCEIMGLEWLLIAKIDRDEVVTRQYQTDPESYRRRILEWLRDAPVSYRDARPPEADRTVNLDQYVRAGTDEVLFTPGVSTCTAVVVTLPGEFSYMAHVSPYDRIYGGRRTDLVGSITRRITDFEVADKVLRELEVIVVTPQVQYTERLIDELVEDGLFLSQITIMKNPEARCADVTHDATTGTTYVTWCFGDDYNDEAVQIGGDARSVGDVMEGLMPDAPGEGA